MVYPATLPDQCCVLLCPPEFLAITRIFSFELILLEVDVVLEVNKFDPILNSALELVPNKETRCKAGYVGLLLKEPKPVAIVDGVPATIAK